jgi:hypothetical protein
MCEQRASLAIVDFDRDLGARTLEVSRASIRCGKYRVLEDQYSHDANDNGPASLNKSAGVARITAMLLLMGKIVGRIMFFSATPGGRLGRGS